MTRSTQTATESGALVERHVGAAATNGSVGVSARFSGDTKAEDGCQSDYVGHIDSVGPTEITGWVKKLSDKTEKVIVSILLDGGLIGTAIGDQRREDLDGCDLGHCAFRFDMPAAVPTVRFADLRAVCPDGCVLPRSESFQLTTSLSGEIEKVTGRHLEGWAIDSRTPDAPVQLELVVDGEAVARCLADRPRKGGGARHEGGRHGFCAELPSKLADGMEKIVHVRFVGHDGEVEGSPTVVTVAAAPDTRFAAKDPAQRNIGRVDVMEGDWIQGWALGPDPETRALVEIVVDGHVATGGKANLSRKDIAKAYGACEFCGFAIKTPAILLDGFEHQVEVRLAHTGATLRNGSVTMKRGKYAGHIEKVSSREILGWVGTRGSAPSHKLRVAATIDGKAIAMSTLTSPRPDVVAAGLVEHAFAFGLEFDPPLTGKSAVHVTLVGTGYELHGSPLEIVASNEKAKVVGNLDSVLRTEITGWAFDLNAPNQVIELDLLVDGKMIGRFETKAYRGDVQRHYPTAGNCGFKVFTPQVLCDGGEHNVQIRVVKTGEILNNSAMDVQFRRAGNLATDAPATALDDLFRDYSLVSKPRLAPVQIKHCTLSVIILNRNGADILPYLFRSFERWCSMTNCEIILVDHASSDGSRSIVDHWAERLPIVRMYLDHNGSFSVSNNRAAEAANGKYLLFLNNDIIFIQDIMSQMLSIIEQTDIGVVGCKLLDVIERHSETEIPPIQHLGVRFCPAGDGRGYSPYDEKFTAYTAPRAYALEDTACTTGAVMLVRRDEFLGVGGFSEGYFYGFEDVDLCLKYRQQLGKRVVTANHLVAMHHRGYTRLTGREAGVTGRLAQNRQQLEERFGYAIKHLFRRSKIARDRIYSVEPLRIAFAVTEYGPMAKAGDYFTALELARELGKVPGVEPVFLAEDENWFELLDTDVLIVMRHDYDLTSILHARTDLLRVAWMRNHFEDWSEQEWFRQFDVYLSSSATFAKHLLEQFNIVAHLFPIATNVDSFAAGQRDSTLASDYCFNGSLWGGGRDVEAALEPEKLPFRLALFGAGWESHERLRRFGRGQLSYSRMPDVYASTSLVIDDANSSARKWGSANSRVFDAIAAGRLVLTNSAAASLDTFDGMLPVWSGKADLTEKLRHYLEHPDEREELAGRLQALVRQQHTYQQRAAALMDILVDHLEETFRIAIKIPVPNARERHAWGDWHFANGLARYLRAGGHRVRIDMLSEWKQKSGMDDVIIVLRGLSSYDPQPDCINLMWLISHPDRVALSEMQGYDHVFVASTSYAQHLIEQEVDASPLLQCTDPQIFHPDPLPAGEGPAKHLFVGNSRRQKRRIVEDAIAGGIPLSIFGREWEGLVTPHAVKGEYIPNDQLRRHYSAAEIVYNDHWDSMGRHGFLSNRLFDAGACGAFVISDRARGLEDVFADTVPTYSDCADLSAKVAYFEAHPEERRKRADRLREIVLAGHTFAHRAEDIVSRIRQIHLKKLRGPTDARLSPRHVPAKNEVVIQG